MKKLILFGIFFVSGCAVLHHVQIGEIDNRTNLKLSPIEFKVSEMGVDLNDARAISKGVLSRNDGKNTNDALRALGYFQMGPHTGAGVYSLAYLENIHKTLLEQCPQGYLTGITGIRETRKYPVISGEIIKIKAFCATQVR